MREIKFRAWEPNLKRFYYFDLYTLYCINPNKVQIPREDEDNAMVLFNINHKPQEQFTGLHDKNGREIYEGDIVRDQYGNVGPCRWVPSTWELLNTGGYVASGEPWEVIGNIHENHELLESH